MKKPTALILTMLCVIAPVAHAENLKWVDEQGITHLTNDPDSIPEVYRDRAEPFKTPRGSEQLPHDPAPKKKEANTAASTRGTEVPYRERNKTMLIDLIVENSREEFLFDTGATNTIVSRALEKKLRLKKISGSEIVLQTANGQVKTYMVMIEKLQLGTMKPKSVTAAVQDFDRPGSQTSGVIGMNFLENFTFSINPHKKTIHLEPLE